ncbi:VOC family protein [Streptomyces sp. cg35]|uniref:VOC family protein n=1 Tax=Streptomyces sp. cg35 TaxID=3421650 RepID=UPI003D185AC3
MAGDRARRRSCLSHAPTPLRSMSRGIPKTEPLGRLGSVALDCDGPRALAEFWAAILGGEITTELTPSAESPALIPA